MNTHFYSRLKYTYRAYYNKYYGGSLLILDKFGNDNLYSEENRIRIFKFYVMVKNE